MFYLPVSSKGGRLVRRMSLDPLVCHCLLVVAVGVLYMCLGTHTYECWMCGVYVFRNTYM